MAKKIIILIILFLIVAVALLIFRGSEDDWLCQNGQWVKHGNPSAPMPTSGCGNQNQQSDIIVESPWSGSTITSPLMIKGRARGGWYFEAVFPITLLDANGNEIGRTQGQAQSDWMTSDFVLFEALLEFQKPATLTGTLVLKNDNPSGLPEKSRKIEIPVSFGMQETMKVRAYFNNNNLDPQISCNKVFPVERQVLKTSAVARAALEELLKGPTDKEKSDGFFTSINPSVKIQSLTLDPPAGGGTAHVDFDGQLEYQIGGSCRVSAIRAQITQTLKQFSSVKNVVISINGRTEDILQP